MRHDDVKKSYTQIGGLWDNENSMFQIGSQMKYEWEQDFIAMKQAVDYLLNGGVQGKNFAFNVLVNRIAQYSCPSSLKEKYKTKEKCPLKDKCKCNGTGTN